MDLLKQCQQWFEQDEAQKVIDTLEAIPAEERTPELDSELAKAYIAVAEIGETGRALYEKALELLEPHEEHFAGDHCWNYRLASAYYFLDEEGPALRYFEKALKARPGDKDTQEYIDDCRRRLSLPRFEKNFRERTQETWAAFAHIEAELRQIMDTDKTHQRGEELVEKCGNALKTALRDTSFELGFNGEKHELILSPEGLRSRLFPLVYFQKQAPESVLEHWNIWVGRQPCEGFELRAGEIEVRAEDVQMWAEETEDHQVSLVLYCEKLTPILKEDTDKVWWALSMLVDQTIGEVSAIAFVAGFDVYAQPKDEPAKLLSELPELLQSMGLSLWRDGSDYLEKSFLAYELEPVKDPEADWRLDVYTGSCRLPVLINDYLTARSDMVDEYHKDGIAAGFLLYPLSGFTGEERVKAILDFRDNLRDAILRDAGEEAVTFLGGATGLYCGYLDFIAWDLPAVLTAAQAFFEGSDLPYAHFHAFRRDVGGVPLLDEKEPEPDIHEETGSLLSAEDIETLESFDEGTTGYFEKMLGWLEDFIKSGVEEGRFSEKQAHQDLQIALWYAFACLNLDDYIHYYRAAEWMKDSEKNATGCATWYYRYSVALMYCGRLEEALEYAERGALEEPDYPWIWLHLGKLRAHFGDKSGALDAVKQGLKLEPGDYEFLTLKKEIKAGATLEQMEYHWINPDADQTLQRGLDENADDKQCAIACIRVDEAGLAEFYELFHPERYSYEKNSPCCEFQYPVQEHLVELSFRMNEAGLSKMGTDWLRQLKERLDSGEWLTHTPEGEPEGILTGVFVDQTRRIGLVYQQPGDDQYFQIFLNPDGTKADAFWSSRKNSEPEVYSEDEMSAMASIVKRKNKYSVVYAYFDEAGKRRQRWETFDTNAEAKKRKAQIEYEQESGTFIVPNAKTLNDLLNEYMSIYGVNTWAMSTYESRRGLMRNYITPIIGDMCLGEITPRMMDKYYRDLLSVKAVSVNNRKPTNEYLTPHTVREIHKLLRNAFNQAVRWELIARNPVLNATLPKEEHKEREIWTADMLAKAMEVCDDPILLLALNLAFSCSLRMGEMLGLTWDCVDVSPHSIDAGNASIFVNKELQRVTRGALDDLSDKGVIKKFPPCIASTHTALVLKEPKTKTSIRRVYLPKTVAKMLVDRKAEIDELKDLFGDEYIDNDLVFCTSNGRPMESQIINRAFNKLIKENGFPHVVFHSLRHSSITYKLKLNGGDMKAVQGDSGHAQMKMVADVYSHIIDEDRCINAQRFEDAFYSQAKAPEPAIQEVEEKETGTTTAESDTAKILELLKNPETAALLKQIVSAL